jgi:hypothetical protein
MTLDKHTLISLFHVLFVGPLLLYVGMSKGDLSNVALWSILVVGIGVGLFHLSKVITLGLTRGWIYALHAFIFAPLIVYVGALGKNSFIAAFSVLKMLAFATIGYHGLYLFQQLKK